MTVATSGFESERLRMRPLTVDDLDAFHQIWGDREVVFWDEEAGDPEHTRTVLEEVVARSREQRAGLGWFLIEERDGGAVVCDVLLQAAPFEEGATEIGWHLCRDRWGRGLATEAARAAARYAFEDVGLTRLVAAVLPDNQRSRRVAMKLGMVLTGRIWHAGREHLRYELRPGWPAGE